MSVKTLTSGQPLVDVFSNDKRTFRTRYVSLHMGEKESHTDFMKDCLHAVCLQPQAEIIQLIKR